MLLPGPEAQKLATYIGWLLHGVRGGLAAGILFVLPGALVMLGLSLLYALGRGIPLIDGALFGIKAAVLVIVVEALIRIGRRALEDVAAARHCRRGLRRHLLFRPAVSADRRSPPRWPASWCAQSSPALLGLQDDVGTLAPPAPERWRQAANGGGGRARRLVGAGRARRLPCSARTTCWSASGCFSRSLRW